MLDIAQSLVTMKNKMHMTNNLLKMIK